MTRGIFIVGNESTLCRAVEAEATNRVEKFATAHIQNKLYDVVKTQEPENDKCIPLEWNSSSQLSARTLVLAAENRLEQIDEAVLVCSPPIIRSSPSDLPPDIIENIISYHIKGWFFLVKEITTIFKKRGRGTLALVFPESSPGSTRDESADILGSSALASFRAFSQGLLASAYNEPYMTVGFSTSETGNEPTFASFIFKTIDELTKRSNGKLFKFGK